MYKNITLALTCALGLAATTAMAEEHEILLVEGGFFPEITYLTAGDTVLFTNVTDGPENVVAADASWSTLEIPSNGSQTIAVTAAMTLGFVFDADSETPKTGTLSFDPAPLQAAMQ